MNDKIFSQEYWSKRYKATDTPWQLKEVSPAFVQWFSKVQPPKDTRILIPGAGGGHEAIWLEQQGYTNIVVLDWAPEVIQAQKKNHPNSTVSWICGDFFAESQKFDLILEQTFFCALPPAMRKAYFQKMGELLASKGKLIGVFFKQISAGGPPFHCSEDDLLFGLSEVFEEVKIVGCEYSIAPRLGNEWWVVVGK
ncbi:MAG: SAM-dependent methyltransferase [Sphingobacteriales bacterium]|jgi:SAM-dependent methyltransferase